MSHVIYTVQMNNVRVAHAEEIPVVDITVKSGSKVFAPTWEMVMALKSGEIGEDVYTAYYDQMMKMSQSNAPAAWGRYSPWIRWLWFATVSPGCSVIDTYLKKNLPVSIIN